MNMMFCTHTHIYIWECGIYIYTYIYIYECGKYMNIRDVCVCVSCILLQSMAKNLDTVLSASP